MTINLEQLQAVFKEGKAADCRLFLEPLNLALDEFDINTVQRIVMFLAQIGHESGQLRYRKELASGAAYEGRADLGNTSPGDGVLYKGRGLIQITGKHNYVLCGLALDLPLFETPSLLEEPVNAVRSAGWYWRNRNLNALCDKDDFRTLTKRINGGLNGYEDRLKLLARARLVIK